MEPAMTEGKLLAAGTLCGDRPGNDGGDEFSVLVVKVNDAKRRGQSEEELA
jgi:hypothetical protein